MSLVSILTVSAYQDSILGTHTFWIFLATIEAIVVLRNLLNLLKPPLFLLEAENLVSRDIRITGWTIHRVVTVLPSWIYTTLVRCSS